MKMRILMLFSSIVVVIFLGEYISANFVENKILKRAVMDWRNGKEHDQNCVKLSDTLGFEPVWGKCGYPDIENMKYSVDSKVLGESSDKKINVLILGDSNTQRGNFDKILQEKLDNAKSGTVFEVLKIGVDSYNTYQEVELLKRLLEKLKPDLIVIQFTLNDFEFTPVVVRENDKLFYFATDGEKNSISNSNLFKISSLYRVYIMNQLLIKNKRLASGDISNMFWKTKNSTMDRTLNELKTLLDGHRVKGVFAIYPIFSDEQWSEPRENILRLLNSKNIDYIDLYNSTETFGGPAYFRSVELGKEDSIHPTRDFDEVVADSLKDYVLKVFDRN